jgi:hypothetical protein
MLKLYFAGTMEMLKMLLIHALGKKRVGKSDLKKKTESKMVLWQLYGASVIFYIRCPYSLCLIPIVQ